MTDTEIAIKASKVFLLLVALLLAYVKTKKGKTVGLLTPLELTSIMVFLFLAFMV